MALKKISIIGVVAGFISQLKPGQDMTKISIPAALLFPFSILEMLGQRECNYFEVLCEINKLTNPVHRMLGVVKWFLCTIQSENWHKKPYNPIIGEHITMSIESKDIGKTVYVAEQVSHHPPVTAYHLYNETANISLSSSSTFAVKFSGNHVTATVDGSGQIKAGKLDEQYNLIRRCPDVIIQNVIWGTRRMFWQGDMTIVCPKTGCTATFKFWEKSNGVNLVKGTVSNTSNVEPSNVTFEGRLGGIIETTVNGEKGVLIDVATVRKGTLHFPAGIETVPLSSINVWGQTSKYIVENNMDKAEESKKRVEQEQRDKTEERKILGEEFVPKWFHSTPNGWIYKEEHIKAKGPFSDTDDDLSDEEGDLTDYLFKLAASKDKKKDKRKSKRKINDEDDDNPKSDKTNLSSEKEKVIDKNS